MSISCHLASEVWCVVTKRGLPLQMGFVQQHKARLAAEISSLRKQADLYNNPATYAKCAKFQRLANAKEKELAGLQEHRDSSVKDRMGSLLYTAKVSLY